MRHHDFWLAKREVIVLVPAMQKFCMGMAVLNSCKLNAGQKHVSVGFEYGQALFMPENTTLLSQLSLAGSTTSPRLT